METLVFVDECGFSLNLHRLYGWAPKGERCYEAVPFNNGKNQQREKPLRVGRLVVAWRREPDWQTRTRLACGRSGNVWVPETVKALSRLSKRLCCRSCPR